MSSNLTSNRALPAQLERYELLCELASGGMGTVYVARRAGPEGFQRFVAVKLCHQALAEDPDFVAMFVDEARLAAMVHHAHVVSTIDVGQAGGELFLAMEYVEGTSLAALMTAAHRAGQRLPMPVVLRIVADLLEGLAAVHAATDVDGRPLGIIHRDVSPQNLLVGVDGASRLADFGVAKAIDHRGVTRAGQTKGKAAYMAPEQLRGETITPSVDVYAAGIVLWEALTGERLFAGRGGARDVTAPSARVLELPRALDALVLKALAPRPEDRYPSAIEFLRRLEHAAPVANPREVARVVEDYVGETLAERRRRVREAARAASAPSTASEAQQAVVVRARVAEAQVEPPAEGEPTVLAGVTMDHPRQRRVALGALAVLGVGFLAWSLAGMGTRVSELEAPAQAPTVPTSTASRTSPAEANPPLAAPGALSPTPAEPPTSTLDRVTSTSTPSAPSVEPTRGAPTPAPRRRLTPAAI